MFLYAISLQADAQVLSESGHTLHRESEMDIDRQRCRPDILHLQGGADNSKYPATTGNFSIASNKEVQFGNFTICDQFSASTASNSHASQNTNDGKYAVHNIDSEEKQSADAVTLINALPEAYDNFSYMPLIETYRNDGSANRNSYGSTITPPIKCPSVDVTVVNKVRSNDTFDNDKGRYKHQSSLLTIQR